MIFTEALKSILMFKMFVCAFVYLILSVWKERTIYKNGCKQLVHFL